MLTSTISHVSAMTTAPMVSSVTGVTRTTRAAHAISRATTAPATTTPHPVSTRAEILFTHDIVLPKGLRAYPLKYSSRLGKATGSLSTPPKLTCAHKNPQRDLCRQGT